jgi:two-component system LytT family sensor kinase
MLSKQGLYWCLQLGGWIVFASVQIAFSILEAGSISDKRLLFLLLEAVACLLITHLLRIFLIKSKWLSDSLLSLIPKSLIVVFLMGIIMYFIRIPINAIAGYLFDTSSAFASIWIVLGQASFYAIVFFLWTVFYISYHYFDRYNATIRYEASMIEIELNNLKSQLNPHFIFNALNSIRALVDENPVKSKLAINQLSNLLRSSLAQDKKGLTSFDDELRIVKDYLGLESIRFEERLITKFDIDPLSRGFYVPSLMIQTLVENGIKHGISRLTSGGSITVKTSVQDDLLTIQIRNTGQLDVTSSKHADREGLGIKNTIQRLKLLYGEAASFRILNESNTFVLTELIIPQQQAHESINR